MAGDPPTGTVFNSIICNYNKRLSITPEQEVHLGYLQEALREAKQCNPVLSAFCVGCVLVTHWPQLDSPGVILSKGYSRELAGNTHAEANALTKACSLSQDDIALLIGEPPPSIDKLLRNADVYTTMVTCTLTFCHYS